MATPNLIAPSPETLSRIKFACLKNLRELGVISPQEVVALAGAHVDDVLDRVFQHCGAVRVRTGPTEWLTVLPGGRVH